MIYADLFAFAAAGTSCGILHGMLAKSHGPIQAIRATFVPRNRRDFWLPPCPFCWVARAALITAGVMAFGDFVLPALAG